MEEKQEKSEKFDYKKLGFKAGLEIHQQLDADGKKLFCYCPSILRQDEPDFTISRKLHAVAGESGEIDIAAKHEAEIGKEFIYECYNDNTCLVELDEQPPYEMNEEALKIALQIALLLNAKILPLSQIMRKTVIDGSNTSGFQRTVMVARDGYIDTKQGRVGIEGIFLEEDAARIIEKKKDISVFRLDRLGIPLIEISTTSEMKTPEQVKEVALHIGNILRSCKVKRGIGTIRQDINLSIKGGKRVEIKGFQEPTMMVKTINHEIERQLNLIKQKKEVKPEVRNALPDGTTEFLRPLPGEARMYPETDLALLKISRDLINDAKKNLPKLRKEIEEELKKKGLGHEMIKLILEKNKIEEFKSLLLIYDNPNLIAKMLVLWQEEIASREKIKNIEQKINIDVIETILQAVKKKKILPEEIKRIMIEITKGKTIEEALKKEKIENIEEKILKIIKEKPGLSLNAYMGLVMNKPEFKGKISGKEAVEIIKKYVKG